VSLLAAALARAQEFVLSPARAPGAPPTIVRRPVDVAVVGLKAGSGASTVAAGIAHALSSAGIDRAEVVEVEREAIEARRADVTVLVVPEEVEPALVAAVGRTLSARLGNLVVVANGVRDRDRWAGRAAVCIPHSRLGAFLAQRGWAAPGAFGVALSRLAETVAAPVPAGP
jgi:hypothetical protein